MHKKSFSNTHPNPTSPLELVDRDFLNTREAAAYLDISLNQLYKLNSAGRVPYCRPTGGKVYYHRSELYDWIMKGRRATIVDINAAATKKFTRINRTITL